MPKEIRSLEWTGQALRILDQTALPRRTTTVEARAYREVIRAIRGMVVRGAPAIGIAGAYAVALAAREVSASAQADFLPRLEEAAKEIRAARPTAVNLSWAVERMLAVARGCGTVAEAQARLEEEALAIHREDIEANQRMGRHGAGLIPEEGAVLTHCNAGALATGGFGTALGVLRAAWEEGKRFTVFATETRPFLQGARLTAWELVQAGIPATLVVDSAAGALVAQGRIGCVIVGADRIAANGDVANKIGTYTLAVLARAHGVPFYVAAPISTLDLSLPSGQHIPIEERDPQEVTRWEGRAVAPEGIGVYNPAFDVTPSSHVTAIVTERGVVWPPFPEGLRNLLQREASVAEGSPL